MPFKDQQRQRQSAATAIAKRRAVVREMLQEAKDKPCADCGISYPYFIMHFDHVRGLKLFELADAQKNPTHRMIASLIEEVAKCDVVCANCHGLRHAPDGDRPCVRPLH